MLLSARACRTITAGIATMVKQFKEIGNMVKLKHTKRFLCVALTLISTIGAAMVRAEATIEEIVVTAQKRAESLQEVPVSISALSANDIESMKLRDASEIAAHVPNLQATNTIGEGFPIFSLRGVSMNDFSLNQSSPVASYVDEVYKGNPAIQGVQIFDLERIEVLRGPQGTLYGKNSTGGAVNFITRRPSFETGGYLRLGVGSHGRKEAQAAFETPLVEDTLAVRLAGTWTEQDGWFENVLPGVEDGNAIDEYGLRASLLWKPSDELQFVLRASIGEVDAVNYGIQPFNLTADGVGAGLYGLYNLLGASTALDAQRTGLDYFEFDSERDAKHTSENASVSLSINWEMSDTLTLTSTTSWDDGEFFVPEDADGSARAVLSPDYFGEADQISQDLRITSNFDGPFNFIAGLYYATEAVYNQTTVGFWTDLDFNADGILDLNDCLDVSLVTFGLGAQTAGGAATEAILNGFGTSLAAFFPGGCRSQNDFDQERTSKAIYADTTYDLSDALTLRVGLRYNEDETDLKNFSSRLNSAEFIPLFNLIPGDPVDPFSRAVNDSITDNEVTGKIGIDYTTTSGTLFYASFSHGYRNGAFNAQAFFDPGELTRVDPELLDALEIGFKSRLLDGRIELNGAVFNYSYENQQFLNIDPVTLAQTLINIDESEITGLDLEIRYNPVEQLRLRAGLGLLNTKVKRGNLSGANLDGNKLPLAPEVNFNLAADWDLLRIDQGALVLMVDTNYVDDHHFDIFNVGRIEQESYWVHNARLQFESADDLWSVGAWVRNLADEEYRTSAIDLQASFGYDYSHVGTTRIYGMDFTYRF
jgi:iron complex outermembrane recepter protein